MSKCSAHTFDESITCIREDGHSGGHQWTEAGAYHFTGGHISTDEFGRDLPWRFAQQTAWLNRERRRLGKKPVAPMTFPPEIEDGWADGYRDDTPPAREKAS